MTPQKRKAEDEIVSSDGKRLKIDEIPYLTLEEEILSESLPLYSVPYEEQVKFLSEILFISLS